MSHQNYYKTICRSRQNSQHLPEKNRDMNSPFLPDLQTLYSDLSSQNKARGIYSHIPAALIMAFCLRCASEAKRPGSLAFGLGEGQQGSGWVSVWQSLLRRRNRLGVAVLYERRRRQQVTVHGPRSRRIQRREEIPESTGRQVHRRGEDDRIRGKHITGSKNNRLNRERRMLQTVVTKLSCH